MKTIRKIVLKNTLGITEKTIEPGQINIIVGKKGTGKTSVLDAINTALSNKNIRTDFIKKGETEASMYVELSDGTTINRSKSLEKSDKIVVKNDGVVSSPESYLKEMFSDKQFRPISFIESTTKEQNKVLLGLVDIKWSMEDIENWFGEIPEGINYDQHILNILDDIQSKRGKYYLTREDLNRDIRHKKAIAEDILKNVPENYNADEWRETKLGELYAEVTKAQDHNQQITDKANLLEVYEDKKKGIVGEYDQKKAHAKTRLNDWKDEKRNEVNEIKKRISMLENQVNEIVNEVKLEEKAIDQKLEQYDVEMKNDIKALDLTVDNAKKCDEQPINIEPLQEAAEHAEKMKAFLNEYDNAMRIHGEIEGMQEESNLCTDKIEVARSLPSELLKTVKSPVEGLSVVDGVPLIKGLPIQNMSTGEQLELAVEIAKQLAGDLGVILVDKLECLDTKSQDEFIETCKKSGLQYFMTKVTDTEYDIIKL